MPVSSVRRALSGGILAGALAMAVSSASAADAKSSTKFPPSAPGDFAVTLLFTSDLQSRLEQVHADGTSCVGAEVSGPTCFGGAARIAGQIAAERAKSANVLVVDAGNSFTGSTFWINHHHHAISRVMTQINIDAMTVGHAEFAGGSEMLRGFIDETRFPLLGANVNVEHDPLLKDRIYPIYVLERSGTRIGLLGYTAEDAAGFAHASAQTRILGVESAIRPWIQAMRNGMQVNKLIAVSYAGFERDKQIAATVDGLSVIVSGNTPDTVAPKPGEPYPLVVKGPSGKPVLIVKASAFGEYLGRVALVYDRSGNLKSWSGAPVLLDGTVAEDTTVRAIVDQLAATVSADAGPVVTAKAP